MGSLRPWIDTLSQHIGEAFSVFFMHLALCAIQLLYGHRLTFNRNNLDI